MHVPKSGTLKELNNGNNIVSTFISFSSDARLLLFSIYNVVA